MTDTEGPDGPAPDGVYVDLRFTQHINCYRYGHLLRMILIMYGEGDSDTKLRAQVVSLYKEKVAGRGYSAPRPDLVSMEHIEEVMEEIRNEIAGNRGACKEEHGPGSPDPV